MDLETQQNVPPQINQSTLRPDVVLVSEATTQLISLKLTVPWNERMEEACERKRVEVCGIMGACTWRWACGTTCITEGEEPFATSTRLRQKIFDKLKDLHRSGITL